jgi:hypothetical protein
MDGTNLAWSALDQLFPVDSKGMFLEPGLTESAFGKVLLRSKAAREQPLQSSKTQGFQQPTMQAVAGGGHHTFQTTMPDVTMSTSTTGVSSFQPSGNLFADFDTMMQDPIWPPDMPGMESPYGPWVRSFLSLHAYSPWCHS